MTEWSLGREMLSTMHEMQSIEDLEQWQALSSHVLDNVELLRVGIKRLASNSEKKESQVSRQIHVVPQTSTSDRSDNVKKMTELTLQNDILQAEVKALRSREEAQAQKLRQYENQNDQLTKRVEKQDFQIAAMEKQMKSSEEKYKKEFEDLSQSLGAMQQHKDMLKSLVQKLQDTQIPENVYVLRNEYDQQQRHLVELQCVQKGLEGRIRFYESKEDENAKTQSAQQQQLFACVAKEQQYEAHMTDLQRQIQSIKQELDCVKGMYMEECRKSEGLVNCVYTAERSVDEVKRQLATVTDMHKQATQR
ncbi:hypothetical protein EON65_45170 [archaeon]|nr:MAG: hypothetical protein EON65_45170 [archaeon]